MPPKGDVEKENHGKKIRTPILTEKNQKLCERLKEVFYTHPLYGDIEMPKLVLCSEPHQHQRQHVRTFDAYADKGKGEWNKDTETVFTELERIIPTEDSFMESYAEELRRFEVFGAIADKRGEGIKEFLAAHRKGPPRESGFVQLAVREVKQPADDHFDAPPEELKDVVKEAPEVVAQKRREDPGYDPDPEEMDEMFGPVDPEGD